MSQAADTAVLPVSPPSPRSPRPWLPWRIHFERQRLRPAPPMDGAAASEMSPRVAAAIAWSLARFQIGEVGEGRVVAAVARSTMAGIDDDYRAALALFIGEEGRHAAILAACVRALGGQLLATTWTERGFAHVRRLAGIRFKLLAMFAAEVVGIGFYGALAGALPPGPVRAALEEIAADERAHLAFHRWFFALQAPRGWRRALFLAAWYSLAPAAALVVLLDHQRTLRTLGISVHTMAARLSSLIVEGAR
jgi:rubrerythrin